MLVIDGNVLAWTIMAFLIPAALIALVRTIAILHFIRRRKHEKS